MRLPFTIETDSDLLDQIGIYWESHSSDSRLEIDCAMDTLLPLRNRIALAEECYIGFPLEWDSAM